jgi:hypothetical protein
MGKIQANELNTESQTIYNLGNTAKILTKLPTQLQTSTGNNVSVGNTATSSQLELIKTAIKTLESNFSNNCCQSNCTSHKTSSKCQVQCYASTTNCYTVNCYYTTSWSTTTLYYRNYGEYSKSL